MEMGGFSWFQFLTVCFLVCHCFHVSFTDEFGCLRESIFTENSGVIKSPNYPGNYPNNYCKTWFLKASEDSRIILKNAEGGYINIQPGVEGLCNQDILEIGPTPHKTYCSIADTIGYYISSSNHVWIRFVTDSQNTASGFRLTYTVVPGKDEEVWGSNCRYLCKTGRECYNEEEKCNGHQDCPDNSDEENCHLPVTTTETLAFDPLQCNIHDIKCRLMSTGETGCLAPEHHCDEVFDCYGGEDEHSTLCQISHKDCDKFFGGKYGNILSPRYPRNYPNSISCEYLIRSTLLNRGIQLRFNAFHLQARKNTDYLVVYDGQHRTSPLLGVFNGIKRPPYMIESDTEWMLVRFRTDAFYTSTGFNITYQTAGLCIPGQISCGVNDKNCFDSKQRCNGVWDCKHHGTDELGCDHCSMNEFSCGKGDYKCYNEDVRCDGKGFCADYSDEKNCTSDKCGSHNGLYLCLNGRCIYEKWICDNSDDCGDGSDESDCSGSPTRVIIAAVVGSLVCSLLLVVALGCTCRLYIFRTRDSCRQRHSTPLSRLQVEIMGRRPPPPSYNEAMLTSRPYEEVRQEIISRSTTNGEIDLANRPLPVPPYESSATVTIATDNCTAELVPESNSDSETSGCDNVNCPSSDDELLDLTDDSDVHIRMTQDVGLLAAWQSNSSLHLDDSGDTQLLDLSEKSSPSCDSDFKSTAQSDCLVDITPNAVSDSPSTESELNDSPINKNETSDSPINKNESSDSPNKNESSDSPTNKNDTSDSPRNKNESSDSPRNKNESSDSPRNKNESSDSSRNENKSSDSSRNENKNEPCDSLSSNSDLNTATSTHILNNISDPHCDNNSNTPDALTLNESLDSNCVTQESTSSTTMPLADLSDTVPLLES